MTLRNAGRRSMTLRIAWLICLVAVIALLAFLPSIHERRSLVVLLLTAPVARPVVRCA